MDRQRSLAGTLALVAALAVGGSACSGRSGSRPSSETSLVTRPSGSGPAGQRPGPGSTAPPQADGRCRVTRPNGSIPPGESPSPGARYHGNRVLWTDLWQDGVIVPKPDEVQEDGSIAVKFPWWRGVVGRLTIEGRRLDGPAAPLRARIPSGYGLTGFQSTAVVFPTEGCWEVTGKVRNATLTVVVKVVKP
jgi:hypothetical protein